MHPIISSFLRRRGVVLKRIWRANWSPRAGEWLRCAVGNCYERRNKGASLYDVKPKHFFPFWLPHNKCKKNHRDSSQVWDILEPTMVMSCMKASYLARCLRTRSSLGDMFIGVVHSRPLKSVLSPRNYSNYPTWDCQLNLDGRRAKQYEDRGMYEQNYCPRREGALQLAAAKHSAGQFFIPP